MAVAAAVIAAAAAAAAAAMTTPATTIHGGMQPVLKHCCDPLIRGNDAGGVQEEEKQFSVWISLLTAGENGGECSMEGDGLRAAFETMDGREQTPSGMGSGVDLDLYVDLDFASRDTNRRSVSEGVVVCAGASVTFFSSRTQKSVTLSFTETEYVALAAGIKETICLLYIWSFIFLDRDVGYTLVKEDNVGAIHLAKNPATTPNSKHINIRHHFILERVANGEFEVVYVASEEQRADFLTKLLHQGAFEVHRNFVMNIHYFFISCG